MKKALKWFFISFSFVFFSIVVGSVLYFSIEYYKAKKLPLDEEVLLSPSVNVAVFDSQNNPIKEYNEIHSAYAKIDSLNKHTLDAFISVEDKTFYSHKGVNYKRILKAFLNNIKSAKIKEGASTITQQLVKNTQLTNEKTLKRKINEIALAKKVENKYTKDQILEMYLNVIYFGNNCYGIENAANYYFSKSATDLSLEESCTLAGIIKSPYKYSPIKNYENSLKRRNLVLNEMQKDGKISQADCVLSKSKPIELNINTEKKNKLNSFSQAALDEAEEILNLPARQIALNEYKIYTYQDPEKQKALEEAFASMDISSDSAGILIDNDKHAVSAFVGKSNYKILDCKRQPGSSIKPILVYAPALNEDIIYPCTQLLDEKTTIADYSPKNVNNSYAGYVSARESLSKSINIPAVKILSYVGIEKAKSYAEDLGITFDEKDDSYTLALGGMTYGVNILQLASAYSCFANNGYFSSPKFVHFIADKNDKIIYINNPSSRKILRDDCCFMLNDMLKTCAQTGTAKKLSSLNIDIASKTGTVGKPNSKKNLDAWNVSYTKDQVCAVWLGNLDNSPIDYTGGNQPTQIVKNYFEKVNDNSTFIVPSSITEKNIDLIELNENHRVVLANPYMPERYVKKEIFSKFNLPNDVSNKFTSIEKPDFKAKVEGKNVQIEFVAKDYLTYKFSPFDNNPYEISSKKGVQSISIPIKNDNLVIEYEIFYTLNPDIKYVDKLKFTNKKDSTESKWFI